MKKIFLLHICLSYIFPLGIENIVLASQYAEEMDLNKNSLSVELMTNGNYCVMYNLNEDLAGFQFNLKNFRQIYGNQEISFRNGQTKKENFSVSYDENTGFILGFSFEGKTLPSGVDTLFEIVSSKIILEPVDFTKGGVAATFDMETDLGLTQINLSTPTLDNLSDTVYIEVTSPEIKACEFLPINTIGLSGNHVIYNSSYDIAGFQFGVTGVLINKAFGGDSNESGFTISNGDNIVLAFSFKGDVIPAGCGRLLTLETDKPPTLLERIVVSSKHGVTLDFKYFKY